MIAITFEGDVERSHEVTAGELVGHKVVGEHHTLAMECSLSPNYRISNCTADGYRLSRDLSLF